MKHIILKFSIFLLLLIPFNEILAQAKILDQVIAVVGDKKVSQSELENQYYQMIAQGASPSNELRCEVLESLLSQKLLVNQAEIDSVEVTEPQIEMQLDQRMRYFVDQIGSEEKLIEYFNKSILEIKEDLRTSIKEQMVTEKMRSEITGNIKVTPSDVKNFYKNLPKDSIPYINAEVEVSQILVYPTSTEEAVFEVKERLLGLRERIVNGENFGTLAVLYSEGPSAPRQGDIGWANKADLDPEYAKVAFGLKKGQVSKIVESSFGFHLIELIDRTDERVHTRHILMKPKISAEAKVKATASLDSIVRYIRLDSLTFEKAAMLFSQDENTRINGGRVVNPYSGNQRFELDQFETKEYLIIQNLKVGEISEPYEYTDEKGKTVFKVIKLTNRTEPHVANLQDDFNLLKSMTRNIKQTEVVNTWIQDKLNSTYVRINPEYRNCSFKIPGWVK
ncbi:MAG: peptidylprolyl isomerase [Bacteroidales bacterium]|nr:peptidylprolyl isomerase [Bacteroidales bacterium]